MRKGKSKIVKIAIESRIHLDYYGGSEITIEDVSSSTTICVLKLDNEAVVRMFSGMRTEVEGEFYDTGLVGKKHKCEKFEFALPDDTTLWNRKERALEIVDSVCPDGWKSDKLFNSQDSFFTKEGKTFARCVIRTWADEDMEEDK